MWWSGGGKLQNTPIGWHGRGKLQNMNKKKEIISRTGIGHEDAMALIPCWSCRVLHKRGKRRLCNGL